MQDLQAQLKAAQDTPTGSAPYASTAVAADKAGLVADTNSRSAAEALAGVNYKVIGSQGFIKS